MHSLHHSLIENVWFIAACKLSFFNTLIMICLNIYITQRFFSLLHQNRAWSLQRRVTICSTVADLDSVHFLSLSSHAFWWRNSAALKATLINPVNVCKRIGHINAQYHCLCCHWLNLQLGSKTRIPLFGTSVANVWCLIPLLVSWINWQILTNIKRRLCIWCASSPQLFSSSV